MRAMPQRLASAEPADPRAEAMRLDEADRQLLLMALAHLSIERPGFDYALNRLALKYDRDKEGRAELYETFRALKDRGDD